MAEQITKKALQGSIDYLNRISGNPSTPYMGQGDDFTHNVGNYHLDGAYGGWQLVQISPGGVCSGITQGHKPKRELYYLIRAYIDGFNAGRSE